jgi:hypothetical protein
MPPLSELLPAHERRFHLLAEPWIPVVERDGRETLVSLTDALVRAHQLQLAGRDPLQRHALTRHLLALTYLAHGYAPHADWDAVANDGRELPSEGLAAVLERVSEHSWLYHPTTPFLQQPELASVLHTSAAKPSLAGETKPLGAIRHEVPSGNNPVWWHDEAELSAPTQAEIARIVVTHWYCALPGNTLANTVSGGTAGRAFSLGAGAMATFTPSAVRSFVAFEGVTLAETLVGNLLADWCDEITPDSTPFWEDQQGHAAAIRDPLFRYTLTDAALLLVPGVGTPRVVLSAGLLPRAATGELKQTLASSDPHTMRVAPRNSGAAHSYVSFSPDRHSFEHLRHFHHQTSRAKLASPCVLAPHALAYPCATSQLRTLSISADGQASGARVKSTVEALLDPGLFQLEGERAAALLIALERVSGAETSAVSRITRHIRQALTPVSDNASHGQDSGQDHGQDHGQDSGQDRGAKAATREPRARPSALLSGMRREVEHLLWQDLEPLVGGLVEQIRTSEQPPTELDAGQKRQLVTASCGVYERLCAPYEASTRHRAPVVKQLDQLRRSLWTL